VTIDFDDRLWRGYREGRALPEQAMCDWMDAVARHVGPRRPLTVLDLGSGTGRFTPSLADRFGGPVYGVEPATKMREIAVESAKHPNVTYIAGRAEEVPLQDNSCDIAFLFFVFHHFTDRSAAAAELARVLRPDGLVFVRTQFGDRLREVSWRRFFPRASQVEQELFPTLGETKTTFTGAGFELVALDEVEFEIAASLAANLERLRHRGVSTLELLSDAEVEEGFAAMGRAAAEDAGRGPVREIGDLLVLRLAPPG
jgi:SAM-dependent methyltransferase